MINRFSSRQQRIDQSFLTERLKHAKSYDRIAGYFSSSILELAGEALESVEGEIRLVCNSDLDPRDIITAKAAQAAMRKEWCNSTPEDYGEASKNRFSRLFNFLSSGKLSVRVIPNKYFGLIHGKAGVITLADGTSTSFLGSVNESVSAWKLNYELLWEDDSSESVAWVQDEFDALWGSPFAVDLADFIIEDIERISRRTVIEDINDWKKEPEPAATVIESPVYRQEVGLWEHQKYFVKLAFDAHKLPFGARFILADQVGLGKTLQLAMAAQLMALAGEKPVLVLAPKPLIWQWQDELHDLLNIPSAVWNGKQWVDENELAYPVAGPESIRKCPRKIGIISTGLIISRSEVARWLENMEYECVILDEAHRARRKNISVGNEFDPPEPNNLLRFIQRVSDKTHSMLLATATPIQLHPIEAWDLLEALSLGSDAVLGGLGSRWRNSKNALELLMGLIESPTELIEQWDWIRNPMPQASAGHEYQILRNALNMDSSDVCADGSAFDQLKPADKTRISRIFNTFLEQHNPFIESIILRTREYLENTIDPETDEPYLKKVTVKLHGERDEDAIKLPLFLEEAYHLAEEFCRLLAQRANAGFFRTLMLRRIGSTMEAGRLTVEKMLGEWEDIDEDEDDEETLSKLRTLTSEERSVLENLIKSINANQEMDPKYAIIRNQLLSAGWLNLGCIVFSQYYDSIWWLANQLTKEFPEEKIGIYAGAGKSGVMHNGVFKKIAREDIKNRVRTGELRLILGTDAASEGLNLQRLGTLINLDLPWNPSRLEQRKGRIQRIGQLRDTVDIYNMRYADSVEDRVHDLLSDRLEDISKLFGQIPDILEDVWVLAAFGEIELAKQTINAVPKKHPFELKYQNVKKIDWETCSTVLDNSERMRYLMGPW